MITKQDVLVAMHKMMLANGMKLKPGQPQGKKAIDKVVSSLIAEGIVSSKNINQSLKKPLTKAELAVIAHKVYVRIHKL